MSVKEGVNIDYLFEVVMNNCDKIYCKIKTKLENNKDKNDNEEKLNILSVENNNKNNNNNKRVNFIEFI